MASLPVPSVQAMVAAIGIDHVPPRYLRPTDADEPVASDGGEAEIPVVDFWRLQLGDGDELARLHIACQDWGFFQVNLILLPLACSFILHIDFILCSFPSFSLTHLPRFLRARFSNC